MIAAANAEATEGGGFRIVMVSSSETEAPLREESSDLYQTLLELDDLRQRGILTEEEFQTEKKKGLDGE